MLVKFKFLLIVFVSFYFGLFAATDFKEQLLSPEGLPIINSIDEKDILPGNFRTSKTVPLFYDSSVNLLGLEDLNVSGSSQFSELSLEAIINAIHKQAGQRHITIVNLRQENGGFLDPEDGHGAIAFSYLMPMPWWTGENSAGNRTVEQIEESEETEMAAITEQRKMTVYGTSDSYAPSDQHGVLYQVDMLVKRALTEKTLAEEKGLGYFRIPDKKFGNMEYEHVDQFVEFVKKLPVNEWVHFHCKKGKSRTTLFMIMFDIMQNADKATAEEIIVRQGPRGLGGVDMFDFPETTEWDYSFKKGWKDFLVHFHAYAKENMKTGYQKSWSEWAAENHIVPPPPVVLSSYYKDPTVKSELPAEDEAPYTGQVLVLNTLNEGKLKVSNFRSSRDLWLSDAMKFRREGIENLNASGSNQYTKIGLSLLIKELKKLSPHVVVVDLRHDDHLFINGLNVSTFETKDALNAPRTPETIMASEKALKAVLQKEKKLELHAIDTKYPKNAFDNRLTLTIAPTQVETPEEVVKSLGAEYLLIGNKRFSSVADEDVTRFVSFVRAQPKDTWYHLHCKKGKSRTTLFLVLLDMMRNADKLSFEEIINRQFVIGGVNLFNVTAKDPNWPEEKEAKKQWVAFLARFHQYAKENMATNFAQSWAEWSVDHKDFMPNIDKFLIDKTPKGI